MRTLLILPALFAIFAASSVALAGETADAAATATASKPWYIGPKGGDTRKGHSPSPSELWAAIHGNDPAPAAVSVTATPKFWYIGPKGGDIRKGHTSSPSELWTVVYGNEPAPAADASVAPRPWYIGPKGGDTRKGAFQR